MKVLKEVAIISVITFLIVVTVMATTVYFVESHIENCAKVYVAN